MPPGEAAKLGAKSFRIGGATDYRAVLGDGAAQFIRRRGRWASDVAEIYQRTLVQTHLQASAAVGLAAGVELEALCDGSWVQPTTR
jgi:hypothetical protein